MKFSKWVFLGAGVYGLLITLPLYNEAGTAQIFPPSVSHPEYYYGFVSTVIAWQVAFIFISRDPLKHRPLIIPAIMEKMFMSPQLLRWLSKDESRAQSLASPRLILFGERCSQFPAF